jgi:hypothetical protein
MEWIVSKPWEKTFTDSQAKLVIQDTFGALFRGKWSGAAFKLRVASLRAVAAGLKHPAGEMHEAFVISSLRLKKVLLSLADLKDIVYAADDQCDRLSIFGILVRCVNFYTSGQEVTAMARSEVTHPCVDGAGRCTFWEPYGDWQFGDEGTDMIFFWPPELGFCPSWEGVLLRVPNAGGGRRHLQ